MKAKKKKILVDENKNKKKILQVKRKKDLID